MLSGLHIVPQTGCCISQHMAPTWHAFPSLWLLVVVNLDLGKQ